MLTTLWYSRHPLRWLLYPCSLVYILFATIHRLYCVTMKKKPMKVPIIVVGNITVGGVGKTPLVITLVKHFQEKGLRVGVVSRGYRSTLKNFPHVIEENDEAQAVGDEPLLIFKHTNAPVAIAPNRMDAVDYLVEHHSCELIISDDGLQHYAMERAIEIAVIDGIRGLGNGLCLPAGPLREGKKRLRTVDFVVMNGQLSDGAYRMDLRPGDIQSLNHQASFENSKTVAAIAGIGHPQRFFNTLTELGVAYRPYVFPDHHRFVPDDLTMPEECIIMTEKDAVKCMSFATASMYYLPVEAVLDDAFWHALFAHKQLEGLI